MRRRCDESKADFDLIILKEAQKIRAEAGNTLGDEELDRTAGGCCNGNCSYKGPKCNCDCGCY